jgi:hypothetical protein
VPLIDSLAGTTKMAELMVDPRRSARTSAGAGLKRRQTRKERPGWPDFMEWTGWDFSQRTAARGFVVAAQQSYG